MRRKCKACKTEHGPVGALIHLFKKHRNDPDFKRDVKGLMKDVYDREVYDLWKISLLPFYWLGLILVAVFAPVIWVVNSLIERWKR